MNKKNRLDKWKQEQKFPVLFDHPVNLDFQKLLDKQESEDKKLSNVDMTMLARELIFDIKDDVPVIQSVS